MDDDSEFEEFEWEGFINQVLGDLSTWIDLEQQAVRDEHDLMTSVYQWDQILGHIEMNASVDSIAFGLYQKLHSKINALLVMMEKDGSLPNIAIVKRDEAELRRLEDDKEHRNWKAVRVDAEGEWRESDRRKAEVKELRELHERLVDIMRLLKEAIEVLEEHPGEPDDHGRTLHEYFKHIFKSAKSYERIFRHLWRNARRAAKHVKKDARNTARHID